MKPSARYIIKASISENLPVDSIKEFNPNAATQGLKPTKYSKKGQSRLDSLLVNKQLLMFDSWDSRIYLPSSHSSS